MPVKLARVALALALCAAFVAAARADEDEKPKEKPKPKQPELPPHIKKCYDAVESAGKACVRGFLRASKKVKDGDKKYQAPMLWSADCWQTCDLTASLLNRRGPGHRVICEACAKMCDECAKACKGFDDDELKECAKECAACARACRDLIKATKEGKKKDDKKAKDDRTAKLGLQELADVTLEPGRAAQVTLKVTRTNVAGELLVKIEALREGVTVKEKAEDLKFAKGASSAKLTLAARDDAPAVTGADGKPSASTAFKLTVKSDD